MKFEPKFYENWKDGNHCLQVAVMMVLNTLNGPVDWKEVNKITQYEDGLYSWPPAAVINLAERIPGTRFISTFDYKDFSECGEDYARGYMKPNWFKDQKQHASENFKKEQTAARGLMSKGLFRKMKIGKGEIEKFLSDHLLIALVDAGKMADKDWIAGHFVLVYGETDDKFLLHDPGLPCHSAWAVGKDQFMKAFQDELIIIPNKGIRFGVEISRNDPCPCGSNKKYKKCCYPKFG